MSNKFPCLLSIFLFLNISQQVLGKEALHKIPNGIQTECAGQNLKIQFYHDNIIRVVKWTPAAIPDSVSLVVIQKSLPDVQLNIQENDTVISLSSSILQVKLQKKDGTVGFMAGDGSALLQENALAAIFPAGEKNENAFTIQQQFHLSPEEGIFGLGQHQYGYMNYRGHTVKLVQTNTDAVTPFLISTMHYGILWDNYSKTVFTDHETGASLWSDVASSISYYFIYGVSMDSVIAGYRQLTGQAPMYGKWAYGYWQSKEHYENRDELVNVVQEYRKRHIPIDNIIQDWDYWDGAANWGQLFFDEKKYPNPKEMIDLIHKQNFHVMISVWPGLGPNTPVYKDMERHGYLYRPVGWAGFKYYDAYNPAANDLYWNYAKKGLFANGIDAWWFDSTEPDVINALTKESSEYELKRMDNNFSGSFAKYLNPYSLRITEDFYKNLRKETDRQRVYILTRSTFAGQQRAAATTWSGDIGANWTVYKHQIPAGVNHCMSGIPYWTFDIGAFVIGSYEGVFCNGGKDPAYQELYTRMFQFGTFCPIFRSHGSETPREIWEFGKFTPALIKFDNLRYRLLPYIYSLAHEITDKGYTIMRGLPMDFSADKRTYSIDDQFMFGPALMVCPVTEYMLHRPPEPSIPVTAEHFKTKDGKPGLDAKYYNDAQFKNLTLEKLDSTINIFWYAGRPTYVTDSTLSIRWEGKLIPTETGRHQFHIKCFGPKRIFLDGKELPFTYQSVEVYTDVVELRAGKEYNFVLETQNYSAGALRVLLYWKTPKIFAQEKITEPRDETRKVYVPGGQRWYDFWTGEIINGGQLITAAAPIDKIPLLVKAGSIIPMGPFMQYAAEKAADPLELRIYPGADGSFTLYEDENDNYNYEKGSFSTIVCRWNDAAKQFTLGARQGAFPGMLENRTFHLIIVRKDNGTGIETTEKSDKVILYHGSTQTAQF
jgi:alpha-D-xyloside xylohydrolase